MLILQEAGLVFPAASWVGAFFLRGKSVNLGFTDFRRSGSMTPEVVHICLDLERLNPNLPNSGIHENDSVVLSDMSRE